MYVLILLLAALPADTWNLRTARVEGAAGNTREAAALVKATAQGIADAGRVRDVALLHSQTRALNQKVTSLALAAEQLDQAE